MDTATINSLKEKYEVLNRRRAELQAKRDKILGRKEAAEKALAEKEQECRDKGIDPAKIDEVLEALVSKYQTHLEEVKEAFDFASSKLSEMEDQ